MNLLTEFGFPESELIDEIEEILGTTERQKISYQDLTDDDLGRTIKSIIDKVLSNIPRYRGLVTSFEGEPRSGTFQAVILLSDLRKSGCNLGDSNYIISEIPRAPSDVS